MKARPSDLQRGRNCQLPGLPLLARSLLFEKVVLGRSRAGGYSRWIELFWTLCVANHKPFSDFTRCCLIRCLKISVVFQCWFIGRHSLLTSIPLSHHMILRNHPFLSLSIATCVPPSSVVEDSCKIASSIEASLHVPLFSHAACSSDEWAVCSSMSEGERRKVR